MITLRTPWSTDLELGLQRAAGQQALDDVGPVQAVHAVAAECAGLLGQRLPLGVHHEIPETTRRGRERGSTCIQVGFTLSKWGKACIKAACARAHAHTHQHTNTQKHTDPYSSCFSATASTSSWRRCHLMRLHSLWKSKAM